MEHNSLVQEQDKQTPAVSQREETEKLVAEAIAGSDGALYSLCRSIEKSVLFRVLRRVRNRADAEDAAQEVLIRVYTKVRELRDPKAFGCWLNRIIVNETNRYMSKNASLGVVIPLADHHNVMQELNEDFCHF